MRSLRKLLVASLVTLHAVTMLCGPGLHATAEGGHRVERDGDAEDRQEGDPDRVPHGFSDHCLACQLFAQGQMSVPIVIAPTSDHVVILDRAPFLGIGNFSLPLHLRPRAPPLQVAGRA